MGVPTAIIPPHHLRDSTKLAGALVAYDMALLTSRLDRKLGRDLVVVRHLEVFCEFETAFN